MMSVIWKRRLLPMSQNFCWSWGPVLRISDDRYPCCYVVVELKAVDFEPEHAGKMNFYLKAVDSQLCTGHDRPTIGILICKKKDKVVVEYALSEIHRPIGVSEYHLTQTLPKKFKDDLPTTMQLEKAL